MHAVLCRNTQYRVILTCIGWSSQSVFPRPSTVVTSCPSTATSGRHTCCTTAMASPRSQVRDKHRTGEKKRILTIYIRPWHSPQSGAHWKHVLRRAGWKTHLAKSGRYYHPQLIDAGLMLLFVEYILVECMKWKDTLLSVGTDHSGRPWQYRLHRLPHHTPPSFPSVPLKKGRNIHKRTRWAEFNRASKVDRQYTSLGGTGEVVFCSSMQCTQIHIPLCYRDNVYLTSHHARSRASWDWIYICWPTEGAIAFAYANYYWKAKTRFLSRAGSSKSL